LFSNAETTHARRETVKNFKSANQHQTTKELIAANIQALMEQLEQGHSEAFTAYLDAMSRFHRYSFGNFLEIARQRPDASRVAGIRTWNQFGRHVRKGEKGFRIFAPMVRDKSEPDEDAEPVPANSRLHVATGFRPFYVFDVDQTEGDELPEPAKPSGEVGECRELLFGFLGWQGIEIE
jgi:antirestriction protein ArdC